jgi:hypothetical protein
MTFYVDGLMPIDLKTPLTFRSAFNFPMQSETARQEVLWGAVLLLIPGIGWILNMGHRIQFVHNMQNDLSARPAWGNYRHLFRHGLITFLGMVYYYFPGLVLIWLGWEERPGILWGAGIVLSVLATLAIPGYMTHYCKAFDKSEIFNPFKSLRRIFQGVWLYWKAWLIALSALTLSFLGLAVFGIGFLVSSVWFWQVAGYSFANVFTRQFQLANS